MRKLSLKDTIDFVKIMNKADLKNELKSIYGDGKKGMSQEALGYEWIVTLLFSVASEGVDNDLYALIGSVAEMPASKIATMSIEALWQNVIKEIAKENNLLNFFNTAVKLMK